MMKTIIFVLLLALNVHLIYSDECGISSIIPRPIGTIDRIIGGIETLVGQYPWIVSLQKKSPYNEDAYHHTCGGTILNRKWILTAAHCLEDLELESTRVVAGAHNIHIWSDGMSIHTVNKFIIHENFYKNSPMDDIGLIQLNEEINFDSSLRLSNSACLPKPDYDLKGFVTATGWGQVSEFGPDSMLLLSVDLPVTTQEYCREIYGKKLIKDTVFCAGSIEGMDTCAGDSGGPVTQIVENNRAIVIGIVSFGGPHSCGTNGWPAVYTEVSKYIDWINNKMV